MSTTVAAVSEQMRFNLHVPPDTANMATKFKLKPTPIVIQKLADSSSDKPPSLDSRMELATRLARRELETALLLKKASLPSHCPITWHSCPVSTTATTPPAVTAPPRKVKSPKPRVGFKKPDTFYAVRRREPHQIAKATTEDRRINEVVSDTEEMTAAAEASNDIKILQKQLTEQLRFYSHNWTSPPPHNNYIPSKNTSNRLEWMSELDKEIKREARRTEEQAIRNTRLLYQLQQKVKEAQRMITSRTKGSVKSQVIRQLAGVHRAALRTLHALTNTTGQGTNPKVIHELTSLLELLCQLSSQANVTSSYEEEGELMLVIHELNRSLNNHYKSAQESKRHSHRLRNHDIVEALATKYIARRELQKPSLTGRKPVTRSKKQFSKPRGVLLKRTVQSKRPVVNTVMTNATSPHFTQQTVASSLKQSPKKLPAVVMPSPSPLTTEEPNVWPWTDERHRSRLETEVARQGWLDAKTMEHVRHLDASHQETQMKLSQLEKQVKELNSKPPSELVKKKHREDYNKGEPEKSPQALTEPESGVHVPQICDNIHNRSHDELDQQSMLEKPVLERMTLRLEEIEKEKCDIQRRWQTVSYDDPQSHTPLHSRSSSYSTPLDPPSPPPAHTSHQITIPPERLVSIQEYQKKYKHYLKLTGVDTDGGFNPWQLIDSICNDLLQEMLADVVSDINSALDSYVHQLFDSEFHQPS